MEEIMIKALLSIVITVLIVVLALFVGNTEINGMNIVIHKPWTAALFLLAFIASVLGK